MFIEGDKIYHNQHYPPHFGIGKDRFDERVRSELAKHFVRTISVNGEDVPKDFCGNVNIDIEDLEDFKTSVETTLKGMDLTIEDMKKEIANDKDKLFDIEYVEQTKTLRITPKPQNTNTEDTKDDGE